LTAIGNETLCRGCSNCRTQKKGELNIMSYVFKGNLCGLLCGDCQEPISEGLVRLYRNRPDQNVTALAVADPDDTFTVLSDEQVRAKEAMLIAETKTDADGSFTFNLGREQKYNGEAFEIDVYCGTVPHRKPARKPPKPRQFSITTVQPSWRTAREKEDDFFSVWRYCIPYRFWCYFRGLFDAWVICGHLTSCQDHAPIPGATVSAFDVDWLQDDALGSAVTDASGHFRIDYTSADFKITPFSPWINVELCGGPDVYFKATLGTDTILNEDRSTGRTPGRENVGPCFCVDLCTDKVHIPVEKQPHWQRVWEFDIHPPAPNAASPFSIEGYAGGPGASYVFGDANYRSGVLLRGNCPLTNISAPANPLQYRFMVGEWTWVGGGDGDPATLPSVAPSGLVPVTQIRDTTVGYVFYTNGLGFSDSADVILTSADLDADGWVKPIYGRNVTVDMRDGSTSVVSITELNFLRTDELIVLNSSAITGTHATRLPGGLPQTQAGRSLTPAQQEPIRRYSLRFEVRDAVTLAPTYNDSLSSIILDNTSVILALDLEELFANLCNPLGGANSLHVLYTVDHPHLNSFSMSISNNNGVVHGAPPMPHGSFLPGPNFFFRGGASGPHQVDNLGGFPVDIHLDPKCAYRCAISWATREYLTGGGSTEILYCK
jgi:hypothetical protein